MIIIVLVWLPELFQKVMKNVPFRCCQLGRWVRGGAETPGLHARVGIQTVDRRHHQILLDDVTCVTSWLCLQCFVIMYFNIKYSLSKINNLENKRTFQIIVVFQRQRLKKKLPYTCNTMIHYWHNECNRHLHVDIILRIRKTQKQFKNNLVKLTSFYTNIIFN